MSKPSPWSKVDDASKKYMTRDEQFKRLPSHLGHGWSDEFYIRMTDDNFETEAVRVRDAGYHVALFKEGPSGYRLWYSEIASTDPIDRDGNVSRWFDYRWQ